MFCQAPFYDKAFIAHSAYTGCPAVGVSTLNVHIYFMAEPMRKPFNSMKVETGRICLVYRTPYKVNFYSFHDTCKVSNLFPVFAEIVASDDIVD